MISIYLRNKEINPSCYYRVTQYICNYPNIKVRSMTADKLYDISLNSNSTGRRILAKVFLYIQINIKSIVYMLQDIFNADTILIQREMIPKHMWLINKFLMRRLYQKKYIIWDFDDDIFLSKEITYFETDLLLEYSDKIIVTNDNLVKKIQNQNNTNFDIIKLPTTDGTIYPFITEQCLGKRFAIYNHSINLVWVGTSVNLNEVKRIIGYIEQAAEQIKQNIKLILVTGKDPGYQSDKIVINYVKWSRESVIDALKISHIGIMPLLNNEFNNGKAGFKLIQYLSASLPIIGDSVGMNKEIITEDVGILIEKDDEWKQAIMNLSTDFNNYRNMAYNCKKRWIENYSSENVANTLNNILSRGEL